MSIAKKFFTNELIEELKDKISKEFINEIISLLNLKIEFKNYKISANYSPNAGTFLMKNWNFDIRIPSKKIKHQNVFKNKSDQFSFPNINAINFLHFCFNLCT